MPISCTDYREAQQLLALQKRLAETNLDPEERKEIEALVKLLEKKLGF